MTTTEGRQALAAAVMVARHERRWSKEEAARKAGVSSITWKRAEDAKSVRDVSLTAIERALGWESGRAYLLLSGVDPDQARVTPADAGDQDIADILGMRLSPHEKRVLIATLRALRGDDLADPQHETG